MAEDNEGFEVCDIIDLLDRPTTSIESPWKNLSTKYSGKCPYARHDSVVCGRSYAPTKLWAKRRRGSLDATLAFLNQYPDEELPRRKWIEAYLGRLVKPANAYIRWNIVLSFMIIFTISSPIWIFFVPIVTEFVAEICITICIIFHLFWIFGIISALRNSNKLLTHNSGDYESQVGNGSSNVKHLVGICIYKEPLDLLISTLNSVASQKHAALKISVVIGMEEGTPDREEKQKIIQTVFTEKFERLFIVSHPKGLDGDIPGKCSNINYAVRTAVANIRAQVAEKSMPKSRWLVTTGDCDSIFGDDYFTTLENEYEMTPVEKRDFNVWQSPIFYAINSHKSPFFVRVTGQLRSFFMMGFLIPLNINTMSIFSLTLDLYQAGDYTHPGYQMEDIIAVIRWSLAIGRQCDIRVLPVATLSGPTSGKNYFDELYEWARQIRRWTIGAAEVFHYFCVKSASLSWRSILSFAFSFIFYYTILLCIIPLFGVVACIFIPLYSTSALISPTLLAYVLPVNFILFYVEMCAVLLINKRCERVFPEGIKDETGGLTRLIHFIFSFPTVVLHSVVVLFAYLEVTVRGKSVCSHSASKKDNLIPSMNKVLPV